MNQVHIPEGDPNRPTRHVTWKDANEEQRRREGKIALETHRARAHVGARRAVPVLESRRARTNGGDNGIAFYTRFQRVLVSSIDGARYRIFRIFQWPRKARLGERI